MSSAEYVVTREQIAALANASRGTTRERDEALLSVLGRCESTWKDLRCARYEGHADSHSSGRVSDGEWVAWASWGRSDDR